MRSAMPAICGGGHRDALVLGPQPEDAYAAQVTHDAPLDLMGRTSAKRGVRRTGGGPDLPCADGKLRKRMAGGHHVVVAYRDRPEYEQGRARFDAYAGEQGAEDGFAPPRYCWPPRG
jgi:hypothetical protein